MQAIKLTSSAIDRPKSLFANKLRGLNSPPPANPAKYITDFSQFWKKQRI